MKLFYFMLCVLFSFNGYAQLSLPIDFESTTYTFVDFDGGQLTHQDNPYSSGINTSSKVAQMVKNAGQPWGGSFMELDAPIDFSMGNTFKMKVYAPAAGVAVLLKVEDSANPAISYEKEVMTTAGNAWEELTFDYSGINTGESYQKVVLIFENGTMGDGSAAFTYWIDDIQLVQGNTLDPVDLPITFEDTNVNYGLTDFGDNASAIVEDPTDPNNTVARSTKLATAQSWAGTTAGENGLATPIPFTETETKMTVRVWSPTAGTPILLKTEDATDPTKSVETLTNTTVAMAWETLEFDFSNEAPGTAVLDLSYTFDKVSIFFNFGTDGATAGEQTYYWDDVMFSGGPSLDQIDLPVTFEDANVDYTLADFGGNASMVVVDPEDPNNTVAQSIKMIDAMTWGGTVMGPDGFVNAVPFSATETTMSVRIWSPDANTPILLKMENADDPTVSVETLTNTTVGNAWETLIFDFSNEAPGTSALDLGQTYNKGAIFFNFGTDGATAGEKTYYWDDVFFAGTTPVVNIQEANIKVFPNPASTFINIVLPENLEETALVSLFDLSGKLMKRENVQDRNTQLNIADLNSGTYFLRIDNRDNSYYQKVMVVK